MASTKDFHDFIMDTLSPLGDISSRKMFSGWGIYKQGEIFAIISDNRLALKIPADEGERFVAQGGERFTYQKKEKIISLPYFFVPDEWYDDTERLIEWASVALRF